MATGVVAIAAAAVIGWTGYPPAQASAALLETVAPVEALGVVPGEAIEVGDPVPAGDRVDAATHATETVAVAALAKAAAKKRTNARATAKKVRLAGSSGGGRVIGRGTKGGWSRAKVSWYGPGFYGNTMAGGGKLRRDSMVVAHRSMKFGTRIEFSYRGRTVTAVVRDRGPYIHGRVFDLGPGTAKALGFSGVGVVKYRIL